MGFDYAACQTSNATIEQQLSQLQQQLNGLQSAQSQNIQALQTSNDTYKTLVQILGIAASVLVGLQSGIFVFQYRRESKREKFEDGNERKRLKAELQGVSDVSKVMALVDKTLNSRLSAEKEALKREGKAQTQLAKITEEFTVFKDFIMTFRQSIEDAYKLN